MFNNSAGFQFQGGTFFNVAGDVHLQTHHHRHLTIQGHNQQEAALQLRAGSPKALDDGSTEASGHELSGVTRNRRDPRPAPYDMSFRRRLPASSSNLEEHSGPISSSSNALIPSFSEWPSHCPIPRSTPAANSASASPSLIGPGRFPTGPLPNISGLAPVHESSDYGGTWQGGESWHNSNLPPPHSDRFQGEPAQSSGVVNITTEHVHHNHHYESWKLGMDVLHRAVALEALYDAADSFPQPRCHPETRTKMLDDLYTWAHSRSARSMCWLHGPAGAGKSAIMQTLCQRLHNDGRLGGSFFFKRGHTTRGNAKVLFATLAYQIALQDRRLKGLISQSTEDDPSVVGRGMDVQLRKLMAEPCQSLTDAAPLILLIDGLDECEGAQAQQTILSLIGNTVCQHPSVFRFLVASRPEPHIRETLAESSLHELYDSVNVERSFEDIRLYFRDEFARIHREHRETMRSVPTPWPSSNILETLVNKSSGYFIYASTVIKFIDDKNWHPADQLKAVQNLANDDSCLPFEALDQLYTQILTGVPARSRAKLCDILCLIANFRLDLCYIEPLLDLKPCDVRLMLRNLHSVLNIGSDDEKITVHHASFIDFLRNRQRSSVFYIGPDTEYHMNVACGVLKTFSQKLKDPWAEVAWALEKSWIEYIILVRPSPALVPLIWLVNPDFVFGGLDDRSRVLSRIKQLLTWMKDIFPFPDELIQHWEDYRSMSDYEERNRKTHLQLRHYHIQPAELNSRLLCPSLRISQPRMNNSSLQVSIDALRALLAHSPHFARIFQAGWLLYHPKFSVSTRAARGRHMMIMLPEEPPQLFFIRILLDISWDDMKAAICLICPILGEEDSKFKEMLLVLPTLCAEIYPESFTSRDLALGFLRIMRKIPYCDLSLEFWTNFNKYGILHWGQHVRSSPHSSLRLLHELHKFVPHWDVSFDEPSSGDYQPGLHPIEFHDVVQWLKASPNSPIELIERWKGYLEQSRSKWPEKPIKEDLTDESLELSSRCRQARRDDTGPLTEIPAEPRFWDEDNVQHWKSFFIE
ncbi:hypothetical protein B0H16DRAFT_134015 [Mycena metata]|uniref:Nephrocystin 3-like N-terminal domain-containing protein n=1 Tax=Mycena metata TaxID=1033252 RepID=A0AAD7MXK7_9AGAR|nr:hypothetical protein B0H16DRAFT_134015 [Mycena metata]